MNEHFSFREYLKINYRGLRLIYQLIPWKNAYMVIFAILQMANTYWAAFFLARFVNDAVAGMNMQKMIIDIIVYVCGGFIIFSSWQWLVGYYFYCGSNIWELANVHLNKKVMSMDYEYMESEMVHNLRREIDAAARNNGSGLNRLFWDSSALIVDFIFGISFVACIVYLFHQSSIVFSGEPWKVFSYCAIFLGLLIVLVMLDIMKKNQMEIDTNSVYDEVTPYFRENVFYTKEYIAKEECGKVIRMFHQQPLLANRLTEVFGRIYKGFEHISEIRYQGAKWSALLEVVIIAFIYFMVGCLVAKGAISVGAICTYTVVLHNFMNLLREGTKGIAELKMNTRYVKMYFDFLDIPNKKYEGTLPVEKRTDDKFTIEFRHVSFRYPGSEVDVLRDFSIKFHIGERLAVVGKNGSGKTTFIKLLCRLYDPTKGEILLNGIDIRKYDYKEYMSLFSVVFQDFKIPAFTLGQNVSAAIEYDEGKVKEALERAGLSELVEHLPNGLDTCLYKDFDAEGVDISGGEAQKVAIARALYHDTPFVILDEPTAALDPLAEYEIYSKFNELIGTKTAVYISHRLSSCQFCNDILVIDEGKAVQRGNHDTLIKDMDGLYYTLWNAQAQYYQV